MLCPFPAAAEIQCDLQEGRLGGTSPGVENTVRSSERSRYYVVHTGIYIMLCSNRLSNKFCRPIQLG